MSTETYTSVQLCQAADITYRQLDYWARSGFLRADGQSLRTGQGVPRAWSREERDRVIFIADQLREGMTLGAAIRKALAGAREKTLDGDALLERLRNAETFIDQIIKNNQPALERDPFGVPFEREVRLRGKREGFRVARAYIEEMMR